jgi:ketosteroid isomerase-like protein
LHRGDKDGALAAVQEGLDYYNRRELGPIFDFLDPKVQWIPPAHSLEQPQRGHAAVREMFDRWLEGWEELRIEVEEVFSAGELIVLFVRQTGCGLSSGVEVENRVGFLWRVDRGRVVRFEVFPRRAEALGGSRDQERLPPG